MDEALAPEKESHVGCADPEAVSPGAVVDRTRVPPKVNARTATGRKHSQLTTVPEHNTGSRLGWLFWRVPAPHRLLVPPLE